ncbi:MAG: PAS domain S-box protein, partial [bacterium]|nr:PAS domain S-box protein [bacterium]
MFRLYGITQAQFGGAYAAWQAALHPDDRQRGDEEIQRALRGEQDFDTEFRVRWPDGTTHNIRAMALVRRDAAGQPLHLVGTNWDITAQKQAEAALRESDDRLNQLAEQSGTITWEVDPQGLYTYISHVAEPVLGYRPDELTGRLHFYELHPEQERAAFKQAALEIFARKQPFENLVNPVQAKDGRVVWVSTNGMPQLHADGSLRGYRGNDTNITVRKQAEEALRESEANFRTFFESMTDIIMVGTPAGRILYTNAAVTHTLSYRAEELAGMQILDLHPADKRGEAADIFAAMFRGERDSCPLPLAAKGGALVPVETRVWFGTWNGAHCLFGICKNLSVEQEATQRFERLFRSNPNLMALSSLPDRCFTDVNDAFLKTLGYALSDVLGKTAAELDFFVQPAQQAALADQLLAAGHIADFELQIRRKDGVVLDGLFSGEVISSQGRQYLLTVMSDITARKRTETELARLSVIQRALMQLATHFVNVPLEQQDAAIDQSLATMGQLIHVDRAYLFAYDFGAGIMTNTHEWCATGIPPQIGNLQAVPAAMFPEWVAAHRRGEPVQVSGVDALPAGGTMRQWLDQQGIRSLIALPLMQGAACLGCVGFDAVRDERVWRDEELALLHVLAELYELYAHFEARRAAERATRALQASLTEARDAAQAAARAKSLFLANMSHEIRTPLNAVLGYAQIMERECRPCPAKQHLSAITRSSDHLLALITDLLELVRSDARTITLAPAIFDFYQLLEDVRVMFVQRPEAQTLTLTMAHTADVPRMLCADQGKLRQILLNLIGNAVKFTAKGSVHVTASLLAGNAPGSITLAIDVEDTGCGIRADELAHVFDLFYLAEHGRQTGTGTGLGLPLSQRYAQALGGDISVTSQFGVGSRFRLIFTAELVRGGAQPAQRGSVLRLAADQRAGRILAVDDDPASCAMLAAMLTPVGFAVETADSAAHALLRLRHAPDVAIVLLDKSMPEMDGYAAIDRMRELAGGHALAIVVVTASGFADERAQALAAGADGFVTKPVLRERLLEEIGRVAGLQYEYEPAAPAAPEPALLEPAALAQLPAGSRRMLDQALRRGDVRLLRSTVAALAPAHAGLAAALRTLIDAYDYDRLRNLLDSSKGTDP